MTGATPKGQVRILFWINTTQLEFNFPYSYAQRVKENGLE